MSAESLWSWAPLLVLGAAHGVNPGMGWLFAVALGLQERDRRAVWRALAPLALGHAAAIAVAVALAIVLGDLLPADWLRWIVAVTLVAFGVRQLVRHRHRAWGASGLRVGFRDLVIWSFLMASAHGAGLMAVPFVPGVPGSTTHVHHTGSVLSPGTQAAPALDMMATSPDATVLGDRAAATLADLTSGLVATVAHSLGYLLVTVLVAVLVYEKLGVRILRSAWVNLDAIWAIALIVTGVLAVT